MIKDPEKIFDLLAKLIYHYEMSSNKDIAFARFKASRIDSEVKKIKNIIDCFETFNEKVNNLLTLDTEDVIKKTLIYIVAIDRLILIDDYLEITMGSRNWLNKELEDKIKVFVTFNTKKDYKHSASTCLSSFLNNIVYFLTYKVDVKSIYVLDDNPNFIVKTENVKRGAIDTEFKVACISYGMDKTEENEIVKFSNETKLKFQPCPTRSKFLDERMVNSYKDATDRGALIAFGSEMTGSENIDKKLFEFFKDSNTSSIIWTPPYHAFENNETYSRGILFDPYNRKSTKIYKVYPYSSSRIDDVYPLEDIKVKEGFVVLHIKKIGRILFLICSDFFHSCMDELISTMKIDMVLISSNTLPDYGKFKDDAGAYIKSDRRILLQCNNCIQMKKALETFKNVTNINEAYLKKGYAPLNIVTKDLVEVNKKIEELLLKEQLPKKCIENCLKMEVCYFMLTFVVLEDRISLKNIEKITRRKEDGQ